MKQRLLYPTSAFHLKSSVGAVALALLCALILAELPAQAQTFSVLHSFTGGGDGGYPYFGFTKDRAGNFYGAANVGGVYGNGVIFKLTHEGSNWLLTPLCSFKGGNDGQSPMTSPIFGLDGALYGTTIGGACTSHGCGTVYRARAACHGVP